MFADFSHCEFSRNGCLQTAGREIHNHTVKDQPSRTRQSQLQQSSTAENWLAGPEKNTDSADGSGPAFSRDRQNSRLAARVNRKFANFQYFKAISVPPLDSK